MDERLLKATQPDGSPRFYPMGQHPATQRYRVQLAHLRYIEDCLKKNIELYRPRVVVAHNLLNFEPDPQLVEMFDSLRRCREAILYIEHTLAVFEEGESLAKLQYLTLIRRQEEDDGA